MDAPPVQYVTTSDGYNIAYGVSGEGRPFVLMPQPFSNLRGQWESESFRPWFESLAAHFKLIQYDCRGEGMSTRGLPEDLCLDHFELDLEAVIEKCRRERVVLCGPTVSGHVAVRYAVRQPERVAALILDSVNLDDPLEGARYLEDLARESWENLLKIPAYNFFRQDAPDRALNFLKEALLQDDYLKRMRIPPTSLKPLLPAIQSPTLVIAVRGPYGPRVTGEEEGKGIAALIPGAKLLIFNPGERMGLTSAIINFVDGLSPVLEARAPQPVTQAPVGREGSRADPAALSARELEVLRLIAAGMTNQHIADELVISINTVLRHVSNIFAKTGSANRAEAASYATRQGLA